MSFSPPSVRFLLAYGMGCAVRVLVVPRVFAQLGLISRCSSISAKRAYLLFIAAPTANKGRKDRKIDDRKMNDRKIQDVQGRRMF